MFDWRGGRRTGVSRLLSLLLVAIAFCDPSLVLRTLVSPVRATVPVNAEPDPVESVATVAVHLAVSRVRVRDVATLSVSRVPHRPESPLAPSWLASALISTFADGSRPLRC